MAVGNFRACLAETLKHEGGWSDHPRDPGGATMKGITIGRYREYYPNATKQDLRNISDADLERIYRNDYWRPVRGDSLPVGIDLSTFDYGVNSGPRQSAKDLQRALGSLYTGKVDGVVGELTLEAARKSDRAAVIKNHCARRLNMYRSLAIWNTFGKGWSRRIAAIEATALSWVLSKSQLEEEARQAETKSNAQSSGAVGAGGVGTVDQVTGTSGLPLGWVLAAVGIVVFIFVVRAVINRHRAQALKAAAEEA